MKIKELKEGERAVIQHLGWKVRRVSAKDGFSMVRIYNEATHQEVYMDGNISCKPIHRV